MLFLEADGTVTGSPFLPRQPYACGNVRDARLEQLWASARMRWTGNITTEELWGFCRNCYYAEQCRGGEQLTAVMTLGLRGNNPFCYHRVTSLARQGVRERLVPWEEAITNPEVDSEPPTRLPGGHHQHVQTQADTQGALSKAGAAGATGEAGVAGEAGRAEADWQPGRFVLVQEPIES